MQLLRTPSPSGRTDAVMQLLGDVLVDLPVELSLTRRGSLLATVAGRLPGGARAVVAHADTIGCMVRDLKDNGRLAVVPVGTHSSRFAEGCRVTILTDDSDRAYVGTILPLLASGHAFGDEVDTQPTGWEHVEVRVDERCSSADDLRALGIKVGDFVAIDSLPVVTDSGYIVARHLDGKAGVAAALGALHALCRDRVGPAARGALPGHDRRGDRPRGQPRPAARTWPRWSRSTTRCARRATTRSRTASPSPWPT